MKAVYQGALEFLFKHQCWCLVQRQYMDENIRSLELDFVGCDISVLLLTFIAWGEK